MVQMFNNYLDSFNEVTTIGPQNIDNITLIYSANQLQVKDNGITTAKIADGAVTTAKLNVSAIVTNLIADGAVTEPKLANSAVSTRTIIPLAVNDSKIQDLDASKLWNASITGSTKLIDNTVSDAKIISLSGTKVTGGIPSFVTDIITFIISAVTYAILSIATSAGQYFTNSQTGDLVITTSSALRHVLIGVKGDGSTDSNMTLGTGFTNINSGSSVNTILATTQENGYAASSLSTNGGFYATKRIKSGAEIVAVTSISAGTTISATGNMTCNNMTASSSCSGNSVSATLNITAGTSVTAGTALFANTSMSCLTYSTIGQYLTVGDYLTVATTIQSSGFVGIGNGSGTPALNMPLNIKGALSSGTTNYISLQSSTGTSTWSIADYIGAGFEIYEPGVANYRLLINKTTGNISISNNNNTYKLDVNGTGRFVGALQLDSTLNITGATTCNSTLAITGDTTCSTNKTDASDWIPASEADLSGLVKIRKSANLYAITNNGVAGTYYVCFNSFNRLTRSTANKGRKLVSVTFAYISNAALSSIGCTMKTNYYSDGATVLQNAITFTGSLVTTGSANMHYKTLTLSTPLYLNDPDTIFSVEVSAVTTSTNIWEVYGLKCNYEYNLL